MNQRIEKMMLQKAQITEQQLKKAQAQVRHVVALIGVTQNPCDDKYGFLLNDKAQFQMFFFK